MWNMADTGLAVGLVSAGISTGIIILAISPNYVKLKAHQFYRMIIKPEEGEEE
jgi:hypothetical protein